MLKRLLMMMVVVILGFGATVRSEEPFAKAIGTVEVKPNDSSAPVEIPYITWGGDVVTMYANGGLVTTPDSIYGKLGLKLKLVPGDDFPGQVKSLLAHKSPFLRAELRMLAIAAEVVNKDAATKQSVIMQLTWSAGDHMVGRPTVRKANDLKNKKVVLQKFGPHIGMLDDILGSAKLTWSDITVIWAKDLTGSDETPAAMFKKDASIDVAFVISPDMIGLTGGIDQEGSGAEGTVKGSKVVVSTAQLSRSLSDVYSVATAYKVKNPDFVNKFVAGYMKGTNEVVALRKAYHANPKSPEGVHYTNRVLKLAQTVYGNKVLPTLEVDAAGLMDDATFVGIEGNAAFFEQENNQAGFAAKMASAETLAKGQGYTTVKVGFPGPGFTYESIAGIAGIKYTAPVMNRQRINAETTVVGSNDTLDDKTLVSFSVAFEPNGAQVDPATLVQDFQQVAKNLSLYGNAVLVVRGHSDPSQVLREMVLAGKAKGVIKEQSTIVMGADGKPTKKRTYYYNGESLNLTNTKAMMKAIDAGDFSGVADHDPQQVLAAATNLSKVRAEAVKSAFVAYAKENNIPFDASQLQAQGVGPSEPNIAKPTTEAEVRQNIRVEFRMVKISGESVKPSDLDF